MTAIWQKDSAGWRLLAPANFPDEATLHTLVEQAPHILPLAGAPRLVVLGREVMLGNGAADLLAIEPSGRLVVIEVKLASNSEARRAIVAQVLTYAAYLKGQDPEALEAALRHHLQYRGYDSLAGAVAANIQDDSFDDVAFARGLAASLEQGHFRLVLVLDDAPAELVRLVGYLQSITDRLAIDLLTVASYDIGGSQVVVPQRVEAERAMLSRPAQTSVSNDETRYVEGADTFAATIDQAPEAHRPQLRRLCEWARSLEREGLARLGTYRGKQGWTLLPYLRTEQAGLVTIWNKNGASLSLWRSVFERRAPASLPVVEQLIPATRVGQGTSITTVSDDLLQALTRAYREAAVGRLDDVPGSPDRCPVAARDSAVS